MATLKNDFKEEQKFTQWWLWPLLLLIISAPFILKFQSILHNGFWNTFGKGILTHIITLGIVILLFAIAKLNTSIDKQGISIHYFPLLKRKWDWEEVEKSAVVTYKFWQVRGWGIRLWTSYGTVYNTKGNKGLFLTLKNGKKYLIGTQKEEELKEVLKQLER